MRKIPALVLGVLLLGGACPSWGESRAPVFFVMDHDHLMSQSTAAEKVRKDIEKKRQAFQDELNQHENILRQEEEALKVAEKTLSEKDFTSRRMDFGKKVSKIHEKVAERRMELEHAIQDARAQIVDKISEIVSVLCQERGVEAVFPKAALVYAKDHLEVTQEVLKRLNTQLPEVKINFKKQKQGQTQE